MDSSSLPPNSGSSFRVVIYVFLIFGVVAVFGLAFLFAYSVRSLRMVTSTINPSVEVSDLTRASQKMKPTDFVEVGTLRSSEQVELGALFDYVRLDEVTKGLIFDVQSICVTATGGIPCMAMSATYDAAFGGKQIVIEGVRTQDEVLVRKLHAYEPGEQIVLPPRGMFYVDWPEIVGALKRCEVQAVTEPAPEGTVRLFLKDSTAIEALPPLRGSLGQALTDAGACGAAFLSR